jgi:hypothetical protein
MRRPFGPEVILSTLEVDMNNGVKLIEVRIATPDSRLVLGAVWGGKREVAAKSNDTCQNKSRVFHWEVCRRSVQST